MDTDQIDWVDEALESEVGVILDEHFPNGIPQPTAHGMCGLVRREGWDE